jgi:hypothetical protein
MAAAGIPTRTTTFGVIPSPYVMLSEAKHLATEQDPRLPSRAAQLLG